MSRICKNSTLFSLTSFSPPPWLYPCYVTSNSVQFSHTSLGTGRRTSCGKGRLAPKALKAPSNHARGSFGSNSSILGHNRKLTSPTCGWAIIAIVWNYAISGWQIITSSLKFRCRPAYKIMTYIRLTSVTRKKSIRNKKSWCFFSRRRIARPHCLRKIHDASCHYHRPILRIRFQFEIERAEARTYYSPATMIFSYGQ